MILTITEKTKKILKNVFLSIDENRLKVVDIQFSNHIEKIIDKSVYPKA